MRQCASVLTLIGRDGSLSDVQIGAKLGLRDRQIRKYLRSLREDGTISIEVKRYEWCGKWTNQRLITVTEKGLHAILEGEIGQQGNPEPGSNPPEAYPADDEDMF